MIRLRDVLAGTKGRLVGAGPMAAPPQDLLFRSIVIDSRQATSDALFFALKGTVTDGHAFLDQVAEKGAACAVVSEEWLTGRLATNNLPPLPVIAVSDTLVALQDLAAYWRSQYPVPLIGVTGSVGKTSTKELIAAVLGTRFRVLKNPGNLNAITGMPLAMLSLTPEVQVAVLEMALYDPGDIATMVKIAQPTIGVVTTIGMSHVERFGSQAAIIAQKGDLIAGLPPDGVAVLNGDDPHVRSMASRSRARLVFYGLGEQNDVRATDVESTGLSGIAFRLTMPGAPTMHVRLPLLGRHSVQTALAATAVGQALGLGLDEILAGLEGEQTHLRLYTVPGPNGSTIIDDTYNSSPQSALAALNLLEELDAGRRIAVLADMLELGAYTEEAHILVGERAAEVVDRLYTIGDRSEKTAETAIAAGMTRNRSSCLPPDGKATLASAVARRTPPAMSS